MKIKSVRAFRFWYKTKVKGIDKNNQDYNENFVGTYHTENNKRIKGFFEMYHGDKPDIKAYLPSILKIAEDGQAIYEFLQNAVDCNSTHFYIFYNEKYFLAINNGEPFDLEGLKSVLNIAQTTKKTCDKIGRFGIGFKLIHRLVGKNEGVSELIEHYKGPILFSWSKFQDLQGLMNREPLEVLYPNKENFQEFQNAPYLLKIILTNFPTEPNEKVKDLQYKDRILFTQEELDELVVFLNTNLAKHSRINNILRQGTFFFLRLGEGKKELIDRDYEDLKKGVQYSMNMLKKLQKVYINDEDIGRQALELEEFEILKNSKEFKAINPEYKDCNIKITFGYYRDYKQSGKIKQSPNFYKYFPMGDETNGFSFILHCDAFSNEANRRKLQKDNTNKNLLPIIANFIASRLEEYKKNNREQFLRLYACLLLSDVPNKQNNEWLKAVFYDILLNYLRTNIPTQNNAFAAKCENVKIKDLDISINLPDWGLGHIQWFEWESKNDLDLVREAKDKEKLGLESWDFADVLENCDVQVANNFLLQNYLLNSPFLQELIEYVKKISEFKWRKNNALLFEKFCKLNFFHYKVKGVIYLTSLNNCLQKDILILQSKHQEIKIILEKLGFIVSEQLVDGEGSSVEKMICEKVRYIKEESKFFEIIAEKTKTNATILSPNEKIILFKHLQDLQGVGKESLKKLILFANRNNELKELNYLVDSSLNLPLWLDFLKINPKENFPELKKYFLDEEDIFAKIILPFWDPLIDNLRNVQISKFYEEVKYYYDLKENNPVFQKQKFVFVQNYQVFTEVSNVFFSQNLKGISDYESLRSAIEKLTRKWLPHKSILHHLQKSPFRLENQSLTDFISKSVALGLDEIKTILELARLNKENFFEHFVVEKKGENYLILRKSKQIFQVRPPKKEVRSFIEENKNISKL
ncbi:MAG: hypothetical protein RMJ97_04985, partial [Raineya sp.]|nr:hypothetical protein [Raineya sp.]